VDNKDYHILNQPVSREAFLEFRDTIFTNKDAFDDFYAKYQKLSEKIPRKYNHSMNIEGSLGDYIYNSKNILSSFHTTNARNVRYSVNVW
jgi:hypothetical protein